MNSKRSLGAAHTCAAQQQCRHIVVTGEQQVPGYKMPIGTTRTYVRVHFVRVRYTSVKNAHVK